MPDAPGAATGSARATVRRASRLDRLLGLAPVPVPACAFEVDADALRCGVFSRQGREWELERLVEEPLPAETFHGGPLGGPLRGREAFDHALEAALAGAARPLTEASLVLPDRWLRLLFAEQDGGPADRLDDAILRFKLKRLVPFRVDDLRVRATAVPVLDGGAGASGEPRLLVAFAIEQVLRDLEAAFRSRGVRIGQIASRSLCLVSVLRASIADRDRARQPGGGYGPDRAGADGGGRLLVNLETDGYCLWHLAGGVPFVVRYRALQADPGDVGQAAHVAQDLRILLGYLEEHLPGHRIGEAVVCGAPAATATWVEMLRDRFALPSRPLAAEDLAFDAGASQAPWHRVAPLLAAASREVV